MKNLLKLLPVVMLLILGVSNAKAQSGRLFFKEGQHGDQNIVVDITDAPGQFYSLTAEHPIGQNDEARSLVLVNVRPGAVITVYNDSNGSAGKDYCVIEVKNLVTEMIIPGFETSWEDNNVRCTTYNDHNDLDGQVSAIRVN
jgi:hypothetical protein